MAKAANADVAEKWTQAYREFMNDGTELMWPSETLIRLFKGNYVPDMDRNYAGKKVLEVGVGRGNNLVFLASLGMELCGTELSEEICTDANTKLNKLGYNADLRVGTNRQLPFPDNSFDFLVSWSVIHYEDNEDDMRKAIAEYARVLKPNGRVFVQTTGPEHKILLNSTTLGSHRYQIGRPDDFRAGQVFFYFDAPNYIEMYFGESFKNVMVGRTHDHLFTETLDWFVVTGTK
jgi:ubiquinone/menaquinone biosynthesis C-methylase UbiE